MLNFLVVSDAFLELEPKGIPNWNNLNGIQEFNLYNEMQQ